MTSGRSAGPHFQHQMVDPPDKPRRIVQLPALCQQSLVEKHGCPVIEMFFFFLQAHYHRMVRIDFQDGLCRGRLLSGGLEHARQVAAHIMLVSHQTGGGIGQAVRHPDFLDALRETGLDFPGQFLVIAGLLFLFLLLGFVFQLQVEPAFVETRFAGTWSANSPPIRPRDR